MRTLSQIAAKQYFVSNKFNKKISPCVLNLSEEYCIEDIALMMPNILFFFINCMVCCFLVLISSLLYRTQLNQHLAFSSPFLRTLLPQPSPEVSSHISDFRKQPRSDSRANRPDTFPNFDLAAAETLYAPTVAPPHAKTTAERYSEIFGKIIFNTSQRVSKIIKNVEQRRETRHRLRELEAEVQRRMSTTTEFVGLSLDDSADDEDDDKPVSVENVQPPKLFPFTLSRIDFNNLRGLTDAHKQNIRKKIATSAARLINPLFHIWFAATRRNLNANNSTNPMSKLNDDDDAENVRTTLTSTPTDVVTSAAQTEEIFNDALVQHTTTAPFDPTQSSNGNDDDIANSTTIAAELAFRNAFYKYSNLMSREYYKNVKSDDTQSHTIADDIPLAVAGNLNQVPMYSSANVDFPIERIDDVTPADDSNNGADNSNEAENVGIFVLEIFGTIVGLGWGAFSQIQSFFTPRN